ncbi:MAG: 3-oxoacyl-ACP reductase family protein [candidate division NC10 bacterium]|nr:3-oxoacyl-ACP reductase family protein [candidate division NC10 bacterium]
MRLAGKKAIVTGGGRGIGRAIAIAFAREGADVLINYLSRDSDAQETSRQVQALGRSALLFKGDVSDSAQVKAMVDLALREWGRIDILVNNAGITHIATPFETTEEDWDRVLRINLKGAFLCCKAVLDTMVKQGGGRIINISSVVGKSGGIAGLTYAASKAGLIGLTKSLATHLAPHNILVNAIAPALIDTEMLRWRTEEQWKETIASTPLKRLGDPMDMAESAVFLASNGGNYITGATIDVNGGLYMD